MKTLTIVTKIIEAAMLAALAFVAYVLLKNCL